MNIAKIRRNIIILVGMMILHGIYQCYVDFKGSDKISLISYLILNLIWIDYVRKVTAPVIKIFEEEE